MELKLSSKVLEYISSTQGFVCAGVHCTASSLAAYIDESACVYLHKGAQYI